MQRRAGKEGGGRRAGRLGRWVGGRKRERERERGREERADTVHGAKCVSMLRAPVMRELPQRSARGATGRRGRGTDRSEETK
jgi:hypothetical protein